jgi:hypothetical protein
MGIFRAGTDELHSTASGWHTLAGELRTTAPTAPRLPFQPSASAVAAIHAGVAAASEALTARTQVTAVKTAAAATAYYESEASSADLLNALTESL